MKRLSLLFLIFTISGCEIGYKKIDDSIAWVHWNEGTGKVVDVLDTADPNKVIILSKYYAKDHEKVFWRQTEIINADAPSFNVLHTQYSFASDKNSVFFQNKVIPGTKPEDFEPLASNYSVSSKAVYFRTHEIIGAYPSTFSIQDFEKNDVYGCYLAADFIGCDKVYEN